MSGLDDFLKGLQSFDQSITQYATGNAIRNAKSQMDELNATAMKDDERNAALQRLSKDLALNLGAIGAPVSQIEQAAGTVAPKIYGTPGEALFAGMQTGNKFAQDVGKQGLEFEEQSATRKEDRAFSRDIKKLAFQRDTDLLAASLKSKGESLKPLTSEEGKALADFSDYEQNLADVQKYLDEQDWLVGPGRDVRAIARGEEGRRTLAEFESLLGRMADSYQKAITGAGVGKEEAEKYVKRLPQAGDWTLSGFRGRLDTSRKLADRTKDNFIRALKVGKRDLSSLDALKKPDQPMGVSQNNQQVVVDRGGGQREVWALQPSGKYKRVK